MVVGRYLRRADDKELQMPRSCWRVPILLVLAATAAAIGAGAASATVTSFTTAGCTTWTAPVGISSELAINAVGSAGGGPTGGKGDEETASFFLVTAGEQFDVCVGVGGGVGGGGGGRDLGGGA